MVNKHFSTQRLFHAVPSIWICNHCWLKGLKLVEPQKSLTGTASAGLHTFGWLLKRWSWDSPFFSLLWLRRSGRLSCVFIFRHRLMIFLVSLASVETVMCFSCTVTSTNDLSVSTWTLFTQMRFLSICSTPSSSMRFRYELVAVRVTILPRGWRWLRGVGRGCQNGRCRRGG